MNLLSTPNRVNAVHININVILIKLNSLNFPDPRCPMANEVSVVL